jgi:beta-galactosidase/beta-glucuronidase
MDIHSIRLRGPWEYEPLSQEIHLPDGKTAERREGLRSGGRIHMPASWQEMVGIDFRGRVRCRRRFACPSGLEPHETVWLVVQGAEGDATVSLNSQPLGDIKGCDRAQRYDVTHLLKERNELVVEITGPRGDITGHDAKAARPLGEVRLEIHGV